MVKRFTQDIIPFHLALCEFWKEKLRHVFHFRSSSKSTYFPYRKILIQNVTLPAMKWDPSLECSGPEGSSGVCPIAISTSY